MDADAFKVTSSGTNPSGGPTSRKLAKKYPETTIMFADVAGFTAWSSDREPEAVFELLETLYEAFDALALAHKVFKVETIGTFTPSAAPSIHDEWRP